MYVLRMLLSNFYLNRLIIDNRIQVPTMPPAVTTQSLVGAVGDATAARSNGVFPQSTAA